MARTRASISALVPSTLNFASVSCGRRGTSVGKSHSWLRPTRRSRQPSAHTISVALAIRLTTRSGASGRMARLADTRGWQQVAEDEAVAGDDLAGLDRDGVPEHRACAGKR